MIKITTNDKIETSVLKSHQILLSDDHYIPVDKLMIGSVVAEFKISIKNKSKKFERKDSIVTSVEYDSECSQCHLDFDQLDKYNYNPIVNGLVIKSVI